MIPGPNELFLCPRCGHVVACRTLMSGNTIGAVYWSDGKREAPMLPEYPAATTCRRCGHFFFFEDAASPEPKDDLEGKEANIAENLDWRECNSALGDGAPRSKPQEIYLRMRLWWSANDPVRHGKSATPSCPEDVFRGNLDTLLRHFEGPDPSETLLRAEVLRELGRFDDARHALGSAVPDEYESTRKKIEELVLRRETTVARLY